MAGREKKGDLSASITMLHTTVTHNAEMLREAVSKGVEKLELTGETARKRTESTVSAELNKMRTELRETKNRLVNSRDQLGTEVREAVACLRDEAGGMRSEIRELRDLIASPGPRPGAGPAEPGHTETPFVPAAPSDPASPRDPDGSAAEAYGTAVNGQQAVVSGPLAEASGMTEAPESAAPRESDAAQRSFGSARVTVAVPEGGYGTVRNGASTGARVECGEHAEHGEYSQHGEFDECGADGRHGECAGRMGRSPEEGAEASTAEDRTGAAPDAEGLVQRVAALVQEGVRGELAGLSENVAVLCGELAAVRAEARQQRATVEALEEGMEALRLLVWERTEPDVPSGPRLSEEHGRLLTAASGISSVVLVGHRELWEHLVVLTAHHPHWRLPARVEELPYDRVAAPLSGRSLIALLGVLREAIVNEPEWDADWALADTVYRRVAERLEGVRPGGGRVTITLDDGAPSDSVACSERGSPDGSEDGSGRGSEDGSAEGCEGGSEGGSQGGGDATGGGGTGPGGDGGNGPAA
ncbi:hypothetical protein E0L36_04430 [Streptomyces sp. AJS327]|uniref:hypothetical protein n=1 Tax=Streptomyces sp. AJS327 TaxID=2545265 RepID=UPI0015DF3013|nr:hypothetical protein [Streptomyces sp. AJS327]MBA0050170.1 hypothetical protein [Streptomyces sp. AJS327]